MNAAQPYIVNFFPMNQVAQTPVLINLNTLQNLDSTPTVQNWHTHSDNTVRFTGPDGLMKYGDQGDNAVIYLI